MLGMKNSAVFEIQIAIVRMSRRISKHTITILITYMSSLNTLAKCKMANPTNPYTLKRLDNDAMKLPAQKNEYH